MINEIRLIIGEWLMYLAFKAMPKGKEKDVFAEFIIKYTEAVIAAMEKK